MEHDLPRLQKVLAAAGVASRRASEEIISSGRVRVNGKVVTVLGTKVDPDQDDIRVDGEPIRAAAPPKPVYLMLHKPVGVVSTAKDAHANQTVLDLVAQVDTRVYPVGRLDADSSGLLPLTNDGEFANRMTHPRYHVPKVYRAVVRGFLDRTAAQRLAAGIDLPDGRTAPAQLEFIGYDSATQTTTVDITLYEGRNRQVRRMMEAVEHPVRSLTRVAFGSLRLSGLAPGTWRKLRPEEVARLLAEARPTATPPKTQRKNPSPLPLTPSPPRGEKGRIQSGSPRPKRGVESPRSIAPPASGGVGVGGGPKQLPIMKEKK